MQAFNPVFQYQTGVGGKVSGVVRDQHHIQGNRVRSNQFVQVAKLFLPCGEAYCAIGFGGLFIKGATFWYPACSAALQGIPGRLFLAPSPFLHEIIGKTGKDGQHIAQVVAHGAKPQFIADALDLKLHVHLGVGDGGGNAHGLGVPVFEGASGLHEECFGWMYGASVH